MDRASYLNRILEKLNPTHDIARDYSANGRIFPAYARYESTSEKYVLSRKATLWRAGEYEHVIFITVPDQAVPDESYDAANRTDPAQVSIGELNELIDFAQHLIADYMEPVLARGGEKYPPKDHMRTFLTVVFVSEAFPSGELIRRIRKYRFDKGYKFSFRGYSQGRLVFVDLAAGEVYTSPAARDVSEFYRRVL